jgi:hypothetical protein
MPIKNSNNTIGNRSRDPPVCSVVPQPLRHRVPPACYSTLPISQDITRQLLKSSASKYRAQCVIYGINIGWKNILFTKVFIISLYLSIARKMSRTIPVTKTSNERSMQLIQSTHFFTLGEIILMRFKILTAVITELRVFKNVTP